MHADVGAHIQVLGICDDGCSKRQEAVICQTPAKIYTTVCVELCTCMDVIFGVQELVWGNMAVAKYYRGLTHTHQGQ
jgi:hypothetical protein